MEKKYKKYLASLFGPSTQGSRPLLKNYLRVVAAIFVVAVVFLFFLFSMNYSLRSFRGNYSGFLRISEKFVTESNPLFRSDSCPLLFENSDFEKGTLQNWMATGNAFEYQPTEGDNLTARRYPLPSNHQGKYWIGTYEKFQGKKGEIPGTIQGDAPSGTLTSTPFIIVEEKIAFLLSGGGQNKRKKIKSCGYVALEVEGQMVLKTTGMNTELMAWQIWEAKKWLGKTGRIVINDVASNRRFFYRHLNVDFFHYYRESAIKKGLIASQSGYDGQFFYFMAFDPFLNKFRDQPRRYYLIIDEPAYRFSRIGFPLMTHIFSLGKAELFPKTMMLLILFSHLLGIFFLVKIIIHYGRNPLWGLFYLLIPGFHVSLHTALPESISAAFLLAGLYYYIRERPIVALPFFATSILVRETGALLVLLIIIYEIFKHKNIHRALILIGSFFPFLGWKIFLTWKLFPLYGWKTLVFSPGDFTLPFSGFIDLYKVILRGDYFQPGILPGFFYPLLLILIFVFAFFFLKEKCDFLTLGLFFFSLLSLILNYKKIWCHVDNGVRTTYEVFLLLIVVFISRRHDGQPRLKYLFLGLSVLILLYDLFFSLLASSFKAGFLISP